MMGLEALGLPTVGSVDRVSSGSGRIGQRTIELGSTVIAVANIGTLTVVDGRRSYLLTIVGGIIALLGVSSFGGSKIFAAIMILLGIALAVWSLVRPVEQYLSIGSCDGRVAIIVSKDRVFLNSVRTFIRDKIDSGSLGGAVINISNSRLEGTIAVGEGAKAFAVN